MNYEEDLLLSLFTKYQGSFNELNQAMKENDFTQEYAKGGATIHRGFYCPSPILDIIAGGCDRGHLIKKPNSRSTFNYLYRKAGDKLKIIDRFDQLGDNAFCLCEREFIIENRSETVAPMYGMTFDIHNLSFLSLCRYDPEGRIVLYLTFLPGYSKCDGYDVDKNDCFYSGEQYCYDEKTGLIESVVSGQKMNGYSSEYAYRFYHDPTGQLVSYQRIGKDDSFPIREISKKKRRIV